MHLTLRQLRYFVAIVEARNMTRAASALNVAPTAVSLQIRLLEQEHGIELLERHSRGVRPTPAGEKFARRAREILDLAYLAQDELAAIGRDKRRKVRMGMLPSIAHSIGIDFMQHVAAEGKSIDLHLLERSTNDLLEMLERNELDFILTAEIHNSPEIEVLDLLAERIVRAAAPGGQDDGVSIRLSNAIGPNIVNYRGDDLCWRKMSNAAAAQGQVLASTYLVESVPVMRQMVVDGLATALVPYVMILREHQAGLVSVRPIVGETFQRTVSLAWRRDADISAATDNFVEVVQDAIANLKIRLGEHAALLGEVDRPAVPAAGSDRSVEAAGSAGA